jgi:hemolysin III
MIADATERLMDAAREIPPKLRGWQHIGTFPVALTAGIVLICLSPPGKARFATTVFAVSSCLLFGASGLLHRAKWSVRWMNLIRRVDHSSIFLLIAGTYTPFAIMLLDGTNAKVLLALVWGGALVGIAFRIFWVGAPRWMFLPVYLALGWASVFWLGDFAAAAGPAILTLIIIGGALYSLGALVYGIRRPNPLPHYFGFHEVFHSLTVMAFVVHYVGVSMLVYSGR